MPAAAPALTERSFGRFARHVTAEGSCLVWTGAKDPTGYGRFHIVSGQMGYAHRVAFVWANGAPADGLDIDHLCRNRACVNPAHLEAVTRRTNLLRGATLTLAHQRGVHCGNSKCPSCKNRAA